MKPLFTVLLVLSSMFSLALIRTQERKLGYEVVELKKNHRDLLEERRRKTIQIAKLSRPQYIEAAINNKSLLRKVQQDQVIHLNSQLDVESLEAKKSWKGKLN